jgi:hypothetical protein
MHCVLADSYSPLTSTIASSELDFCVRNENRYDLTDEPPGHNAQCVNIAIRISETNTCKHVSPEHLEEMF